MDSTMKANELNERQIRKIAVEADADPRTVRKVLAGKETGSSASERVKRVLERAPKRGKERA